MKAVRKVKRAEFAAALIDRSVPWKPRAVYGVKGHNIIKSYYIAGKPRRACPVLTGWPGSFKICIIKWS